MRVAAEEIHPVFFAGIPPQAAEADRNWQPRVTVDGLFYAVVDSLVAAPVGRSKVGFAVGMAAGMGFAG